MHEKVEIGVGHRVGNIFRFLSFFIHSLLQIILRYNKSGIELITEKYFKHYTHTHKIQKFEANACNIRSP